MFSWSSTPNYNNRQPQGVRVATATTNTTTTNARPATTTTAGVSSGYYRRQQHLDSYLKDPILSKSTRRFSKDDTTHDTVFQTVAGTALVLRVHMPSREGAVPIMTLIGVKALHPWLQDTGKTGLNRVMGYPPIASTEDYWNNTCKILLGTAVNQVITHLQLNPPTILLFTDKSLEKLQQKPSHTQDVPRPPEEETFDIPIPQIPSSFPELDTMTLVEVKEALALLDNNESIHTWLVTNTNNSKISAGMKTLDKFHHELVENNCNTAKNHLSQQDDLWTLYSTVQTQQQQVSATHEQIRQLSMTHAELFGIRSPEEQPRRIVRKLRGAEREAFVQSEEYGNHWLNDDDTTSTSTTTTDDFIQGFMATRKLYHTRAATIERLSSTSTGNVVSN